MKNKPIQRNISSLKSGRMLTTRYYRLTKEMYFHQHLTDLEPRLQKRLVCANTRKQSQILLSENAWGIYGRWNLRALEFNACWLPCTVNMASLYVVCVGNLLLLWRFAGKEQPFFIKVKVPRGEKLMYKSAFCGWNKSLTWFSGK